MRSAIWWREPGATRAVRAIFARAGAALGVALANLVNIFDPALLLIGGEGVAGRRVAPESSPRGYPAARLWRLGR